jgi:protein arginine kinase activator
MTCDICGKKKATVHLTEIVDQQMTEMHLCEDCARQKSTQMEQQFGLADLLAGLSDFNKPTAKQEQSEELKCSQCGLLYEDFRKFGRLGCGKCYESFKEHLGGLLRKIHGSNKHLGKMPVDKSAKGAKIVKKVNPLLATQEIDDLRRQLNQAVDQEDFEKAAL